MRCTNCFASEINLSHSRSSNGRLEKSRIIHFPRISSPRSDGSNDRIVDCGSASRVGIHGVNDKSLSTSQQGKAAERKKIQHALLHALPVACLPLTRIDALK